MEVTFYCGLVTQDNYNVELGVFLSPHYSDYFYKQFNIFLAEYAYWRSCLKFKTILFNDVENSPLLDLPGKTVKFENDKMSFTNRLTRKAESLLDNEGI